MEAGPARAAWRHGVAAAWRWRSPHGASAHKPELTQQHYKQPVFLSCRAALPSLAGPHPQRPPLPYPARTQAAGRSLVMQSKEL